MAVPRECPSGSCTAREILAGDCLAFGDYIYGGVRTLATLSEPELPCLLEPAFLVAMCSLQALGLNI